MSAESDPAQRAALVEERDFLLASLADLDRELAAGDLDAADHRTLRAEYTTRAAAVLRRLEGPASGAASGTRAADRSDPARPDPDGDPAVGGATVGGATVGGSTVEGSGGDGDRADRRPGVWTAAIVVVIAVVAGLAVMQSSGRRGQGGLTGLDVSAASARLDECQAADAAGVPDEALECYDSILESLPGNIGALSFRGWLRVRQGDLDGGLADLDAAIQLDPGVTGPYVFRASGRSRAGDAPGAVADLAAFYGNDPDETERGLADGFAPGIVAAALDACVAGDVAGSTPAVDVLVCYRDVLTVDPGNPTANIYLGWLLARTRSDATADEVAPLLDAGLASEALGPEDPARAAGLVFRAAWRAHRGDLAGATADLAAFDALPSSAEQVAAAEHVRSAIAEGRDPLG